MILTVLFNLVLAALAAPLLLYWSSTWWDVVPLLFFLQFLSFIPATKRHLIYAKDIFLPSSVFLMYVGLNFIVGAYFVAQDRGVNSTLGGDVKTIQNYPWITVFYILVNLLAFVLTIRSLQTMNSRRATSVTVEFPRVFTVGANYLTLSSSVVAISFVAVSIVEPLFSFSIQLLLLVIQLMLISNCGRLYRGVVYLFYLVIFTAFNFSNKREIAVALIVVMYFELLYSNAKMKMTLKTIALGGVAGVLFCLLVMAASISRGYGGFELSSSFAAFALIPKYVMSDLFLDSIIENFELSYVFAAAYIAADYVMTGQLDYQFGLSYLKPLFFLFDREIYWWKPDSVMILFTKRYDPAFYSLGGSYPVLSPTEAFINFHYFGLIPFGLLLAVGNKFFVGLEFGAGRAFRVLSRFILVFTFFFYIRGSGLELYFLYFIFALPYLLLFSIFEKMITARPVRAY
mgnify:CR=1 FL=1